MTRTSHLARPGALLAILVGLGSVPAAAAPVAEANVVRSVDGTIRIAQGAPNGPVLGATPEAAARAFVERSAADLGVAHTGELAVTALHASVLGPSVRFEQRVLGLPVVGADLVVSLTPENRLRFVSNGLKAFSRIANDWRLDARAAIALAARGIDGVIVKDGSPVGVARRVFYVRGGIARAAYEIRLAHFNLLRNLFAVVDAATGERVSLANRVFYAADDALIWDPSPGRNCDQPLSRVSVPDLATPPPDQSGHLNGAKLTTSNCCYHANCDPTQPPARVQGTMSIGGQIIQYDTVVCDRAQTATNNQDCRTDYVYPWAAEPTLAAPSTSNGSSPTVDPADEDPFAEVNAYVQADKAYQWFRTLDPTFDLTGNKVSPPRTPLVWVNLLFPDLSGINPVSTSFKIDKFMRVDNAAFISGATWAQLAPFLGGQAPDSDTLVFFQGTQADFAYDGSVVYHEFGHAVVASTANFDVMSSKVDSSGAMNEAGTLHEAFSDYFSSAIRNNSVLGDFAVPRMSTAAGNIFNNLVAFPLDIGPRDLGRNDALPDLLDGEIHNDSQFFSEAMWGARQQLAGCSTGTWTPACALNAAAFDKAVYGALVALSSSAGLSDAIQGIRAAVGASFPTNGSSTVEAAFVAHGMIKNPDGSFSVSRLQTLIGPKATLDVVGTNPASGPGPYAPAPAQFQVWAPQGASRLTVQFTTGLASLFTGAPSATLLVSLNRPITFDVTTPTAITDDSQVQQAFAPPSLSNPSSTATVSFAAGADGGTGAGTDGGVIVAVPCGGAWINFAIVSNAGPIVASGLTASVAADPSCTWADGGFSPDAGLVDAGSAPPPVLCQTRDSGIAGEGCPDAGPVIDAGVADAGPLADAGTPKPPGGCGCGASGLAPAALIGFLALGLRRRATRRRAS